MFIQPFVLVVTMWGYVLDKFGVYKNMQFFLLLSFFQFLLLFDMISATYNHSTADMFVVVFSSSVLPGMIPWFVILLAELRFRRNNKT